MQTLAFAVVALGILAFGLVSGRAQRSILTPPMAFVAFGYAISEHGLGLVDLHLEHSFIHLLAEVTLVLVLFGDAARIDLGRLRREHDLPVRMLVVGMPLTIVAGALAAWWLLPGLQFWELFLLAAILAPTDAALGQAVVSSPKVPVRIRQALNVESGLNDGIALPVVLMLFSVACAMAAQESVAYWLIFGAKQVIFGPLVGMAVGYIGARLVDRAIATGWMNETYHELAALGLALLAFSGAELIHGNGFIAAFVAGLVLGNTAREIGAIERFAEVEGHLLTLLVFLAFGATMVPEVFAHDSWRIWLYAVLSLTVVRMVPVAISLIGMRLCPTTTLFLGWFGPRGIASVLFALLVLERAEGRHEGLIPIVMATVLLSVFAHGLTANPLANLYARRAGSLPDDRPEHRAVEAMPARLPE